MTDDHYLTLKDNVKDLDNGVKNVQDKLETTIDKVDSVLETLNKDTGILTRLAVVEQKQTTTETKVNKLFTLTLSGGASIIGAILMFLLNKIKLS